MFYASHGYTHAFAPQDHVNALSYPNHHHHFLIEKHTIVHPKSELAIHGIYLLLGPRPQYCNPRDRRKKKLKYQTFKDTLEDSNSYVTLTILTTSVHGGIHTRWSTSNSHRHQRLALSLCLMHVLNTIWRFFNKSMLKEKKNCQSNPCISYKHSLQEVESTWRSLEVTYNEFT